MGFNTSSFKSHIVIYTNRPIVPIGITSIVSFYQLIIINQKGNYYSYIDK